MMMMKKKKEKTMNTDRDSPDALLKIGVARKCLTSTRALGVAIGVVDRAAQQSAYLRFDFSGD